MASYIAKSNDEWARVLSSKNVVDNVNHWSPSPLPLLRSLPGHYLFFFASTSSLKKRMVGWGTVREQYSDTVANAWARFGDANGVASLDEMLERLNSFSSVPKSDPKTASSPIGNTIVDGVV